NSIFTQLHQIETWLFKNFKKRIISPKFNFTLSYIQGLNHNLSVQELASLQNFSTRQIQRIFQQHIGLSPKSYHRIFRTKKAKHLLKNSPQYSCTEIAYLLDYSDQSHFIHDFKLCAKLTPQQYRDLCIKKS
ncbi:helix-turn-helix domain-containing protein, partial [bacterium]|nr:helix-turn-helix domain-containing protein [bacterium]